MKLKTYIHIFPIIYYYSACELLDIEDISSDIPPPLTLEALAEDILEEIWMEPGGGVIPRVEMAEAEEDDDIYDFLLPICFCKQGTLLSVNYLFSMHCKVLQYITFN
jgi:hypothetical protein